jgi:uncharacterized protein (DUF1697 family)
MIFFATRGKGRRTGCAFHTAPRAARIVDHRNNMNTYIALFRGINVGGKNILPMKELAALFETLGCENVRTYIQSGNVVFQSKKVFEREHVHRIGHRVREMKGFEPRVLLVRPDQLHRAVENNPFPTSDGKALHFFFLEAPPHQPQMDRLEAVRKTSEEFELIETVFYLYAPEGVGRSKLAASVEQALGVPVTARNWSTVARLVAMAGQT